MISRKNHTRPNPTWLLANRLDRRLPWLKSHNWLRPSCNSMLLLDAYTLMQTMINVAKRTKWKIMSTTIRRYGNYCGIHWLAKLKCTYNMRAYPRSVARRAARHVGHSTRRDLDGSSQGRRTVLCNAHRQHDHNSIGSARQRSVCDSKSDAN